MHCGSVAGSSREKELTLEQCYRIAKEIIELGCKELTFIGGEIFLFRDWEKIANYLTKHGLRVNLMSNGYMLRRRHIEQIKHANLSNVGISLDGTKTIHNKIRRNLKSYDEIQNAFDLLNSAKIPIAVVTSLMEMNYSLLDELYQFLVKNNVNLWQIQLVNPMGNMADNKDLILNRRHIPDLIRFIRKKNKDKYMLVVAADNIGYYDEDNEVYIRGNKLPACYWGGCLAGINTLFIDSVGNIKGCGALYDERFIEGNVNNTSLAEIWYHKDSFSYNRKFSNDFLTGNCKNCDIGSVCKGGCRASNYFITGSLYSNGYCMHNDNKVCKDH